VFEAIRQSVETKANKDDTLLKSDLNKFEERYEKIITDNTRRIIEMENKVKTAENEVQELHQSIRML
jgi:hypothetical protein